MSEQTSQHSKLKRKTIQQQSPPSSSSFPTPVASILMTERGSSDDEFHFQPKKKKQVTFTSSTKQPESSQVGFVGVSGTTLTATVKEDNVSAFAETPKQHPDTDMKNQTADEENKDDSVDDFSDGMEIDDSEDEGNRVPNPGGDYSQFEDDLAFDYDEDSHDIKIEVGEPYGLNHSVRDVGIQVHVSELKEFAPVGAINTGRGTAIFSIEDHNLQGHHKKVPRIKRYHTYECKAIHSADTGHLGIMLVTKVRRKVGRTWKFFPARGGWACAGDTARAILSEIEKGRVVFANVKWVKKYFWYKMGSDCWDGRLYWRSYLDADSAAYAPEDQEMSCYEDGSDAEP